MMIKPYKERNVILLLFSFSLFFSLPLLLGQLDPDYYSYLLTGRGVKNGLDMFADFSTNKGITNHLFFTFVSYLFDSNITMAAFVLSSFADTITVYLSIKVVELWLNKKVDLSNKNVFLSLILYLALLKSFLIGPYLGGFLSESITFPLILASLFFFKKNKRPLSAFLFSLGILGRSTLMFFSIMFVFNDVVINKNYKKLIQFIFYGIVSSLFIIYLSTFWGSFSSFYDNYIIHNLNYAGAIKQSKYSHFLTSLSSLPTITYSLILSVISLCIFLFSRKNNSKEKLTILAILISSYFSTFTGGLFFYHHFYQFSLIVFISVIYVVNNLKKTLQIIIATFSIAILFLHFTSYIFFSKPNSGFDQRVYAKIEYSTSTYLRIISYHPDYYLVSGKMSPDRYYIPFFLSDMYDSRSEFYKSEHKKINKKVLKDTLFVAIIKNQTDNKITNEYLSQFKEIFKLVQIDEITDNSTPYRAYFFKSEIN